MSQHPGSGDYDFRVIGCGLPRTGTTSLRRALDILTGQPVFDGGSTAFSGSYQQQKQLLRLAKHVPARTAADNDVVLQTLAEFTHGCVASVDTPGCYLVKELLQLYPDAKVVCTVRDKASWWASYSTLQTYIHELSFLSWLSPSLHRFCAVSYGLWKCAPAAVGIPERPAWPLQNHEGLYEAHTEYVRRVGPEKQLYFYDVRDGWGPLCEILGVAVPDCPFPHEFSRTNLTEAKEELMRKLRLRFMTLVAAGGFSVWLALRIYKLR